MPLHVHPLLTLPDVAERAADILRVPPPGDDPFATDVLVVGGRGVEQWLRLALAQRLDIVTNLDVRSPSRFVQDLERWATNDAPASASALTLDVLAAVHADPTLLPAELRHLTAEAPAPTSADPARPAAASRLGTVGPLLAAWAARMARTFERYQLHRHDWLRAWERGTQPSDAPDPWQARLWRAVVAVAPRTLAPAAAHEATRAALGTVRATA
ncbi:MAG TPA: exodeoxyribonuclease V subunit gamma, partial [Gemmatimonadaceae bacterium]|nr:exodeoxyribonuclease V subunit gamma [Gemmatimonadaceae bacterium]